MTVTQVPFFLSSASGRRPNAGGTKFTVECSPALSIPSDATSCTLQVNLCKTLLATTNILQQLTTCVLLQQPGRRHVLGANVTSDGAKTGRSAVVKQVSAVQGQ